MSKKSVIVTTQTFYQEDSDGVDKVRYQIALDTIGKLTHLGIPISIIDGGSPDYMVKEFISRGAYVFRQKGKTYASSVKQAFEVAYDKNKDNVIWTEIEKVSLIGELDKILLPLENNDLIIPRRNEKLRKQTYPKTQFLLEEFCNIYWQQLTRTNFDITFGVKAMNRETSKLFLDYDESNGKKWECLQIPVIEAIKKKKQVNEVEVNFIYPEEQKNVEIENFKIHKKRIDQLTNVTSAWKRYLENHDG